MKPFIFNFLDRSIQDVGDATKLIEYSEKLNLSVIKDTDYPAIALHDLSTQTMKKGKGSEPDTDKNEYLSKTFLDNIGTQTMTRVDREVSDSDYNSALNAVKALTDTQTLTLTGGEGTDADHQQLYQMLATRTITESKETTDSDS